MKINQDTVFAVIGLGLLGGSMAKGLHQAGFQVIGIDIDPAAIEYGLEAGWITRGGMDASLISDADIVISCLYPKAFIKWVKENGKYFKKNAVLTDVTGVKRAVIGAVNEALPEGIEFIAGHPMAGREFKGIRYADSGRFLTANYIITPTENNTQQAVDTVYEMARILNFAHIAVLTPAEHDRMIAFLSQLTHIIAVSLMNAEDNSELAEYTGDSFRDLTRIARINEDLWPELFVSNKDLLLEEVDKFIHEITLFRDMIADEDIQGMREKLLISTERRAAFDKR